MKKVLLSAAVFCILTAALVVIDPANAAAPFPADIHGVVLRDGDIISANEVTGDPDIFIVKIKSFYGASDPGAIPDSYNGFKRLFLNPAIFNMYGHLGGFARVRQVTAAVRDSFVTSGLFRNCETGDLRVWATEVTGEDNGILHHVQMTGDQAAAEDPRFFDRVFCINTREDNFYAKSVNPYYRLVDIPIYFRRTCQIRPACTTQNPPCLLAEPAEGWCPVNTTLPCAAEGESPSNASLGPNQLRNGSCCPGLVVVNQFPGQLPPPGSSSNVCARPGCYYQQVECFTTPCNPILVCPSPIAGPCYVGGCSGQLCTDQPGAVSTCEYRAEYACYQHSRCERLTTGVCGWTPTDQFNQCLANTTSGY